MFAEETEKNYESSHSSWSPSRDLNRYIMNTVFECINECFKFEVLIEVSYSFSNLMEGHCCKYLNKTQMQDIRCKKVTEVCFVKCKLSGIW
jgi:hypothetical protein